MTKIIDFNTVLLFEKALYFIRCTGLFVNPLCGYHFSIKVLIS